MSDFDDFCGDYTLDLLSVDTANVERVKSMFLSSGSSRVLFTLELDDTEIIRCAATLFSQALITREQMATLLEYKAMRDAFGEVSETPLFSIDNTLVDSFITRTFSESVCDRFAVTLRDKPHSEQKLYSMIINKPSRQLLGLLLLAEKFGMIAIEQPALLGSNSNEGQYRVSSLSVGARDALIRARFAEHAKDLLPSIGIFTKERIEEGLRKGGRYSALSYPGVLGAPSFHDIKAPAFFMSLHDEVHRVAISSIPNKTYYSLIEAVDVVRRASVSSSSNGEGIRWSKDLWDALDMAVSDFLFMTEEARESTSSKQCTEHFYTLLQAYMFAEERPNGLFFDSPYIDTTWVLLIDLHKNKERWHKTFRVDASLFPEKSAFFRMYNFIVHNEDLIDSAEHMAVTAARLKAKYLGLQYQDDAQIELSRKKGYLELSVNDAPLGLSKADFLSFITGRASHRALEYLAFSDPVMFRAYVCDVEKFNQLRLKFPRREGELLEQLLSSPTHLLKIIFTLDHFINFAHSFYAESQSLLAETLLKSDVLFFAYVKNSFDLIKLCECFDGHEEQFLSKILTLKERDTLKVLLTKHELFSSILEKYPELNTKIREKTRELLQSPVVGYASFHSLSSLDKTGKSHEGSPAENADAESKGDGNEPDDELGLEF